MTTDSFFALAVGGMIALFFGTMLAFGGYRFFLFLLPVLGFFFGFGLGAQTVQALFGDGFLSSITSWVVGFGFALVFALLSYAFYFVAVGLIGAALGYALGVGILEAIGLNFGFIVWLVGIIAAMAVGAATLIFNVQKYVVIAATALLGAGVIVGTFLFLFGGQQAAQLTQNPVRTALQNSPLWTIIFIVVAILGLVAQYQSTKNYEVETYNRLAEASGTAPVEAMQSDTPAPGPAGV
ncbi:MAG TPA: DUF4203 domain-containing protein [Chloroflexota bacterium]|jgi:hypothetical protein|nr:DUF4203 domain-containing protein [Chloroflexota bacterium]